MTTTEELLARFLFLFLKHLTVELSHLFTLPNHHPSPLKSILRRPAEKLTPLNPNHPVVSLSSVEQRRVLFTHIDCLEFDPQLPGRFLDHPRREQFYTSGADSHMQCLCHQSKISFKAKCKIKRKRQRK
jgi:hypothetical protein